MRRNVHGYVSWIDTTFKRREAIRHFYGSRYILSTRLPSYTNTVIGLRMTSMVLIDYRDSVVSFQKNGIGGGGKGWEVKERVGKDGMGDKVEGWKWMANRGSCSWCHWPKPFYKDKSLLRTAAQRTQVTIAWQLTHDAVDAASLIRLYDSLLHFDFTIVLSLVCPRCVLSSLLKGSIVGLFWNARFFDIACFPFKTIFSAPLSHRIRRRSYEL